ncbi:MAG: response regulator [Candidatus Latescibacteria bacterium]|jgi:CheY-like chemotaxis protein|nr:response regulator [Candidatus Latescibacterota bacterium]
MPTVIVIEDQKPVRDSIGEILELIGCETRLVGDGQVALDILLKSKFNLITLDLNMPSLDGLSLAESLSIQENPNNDTPIIVISAYLSEDTLTSIKELGIKHWLPKPFEAEELIKLVRSTLNIKE